MDLTFLPLPNDVCSLISKMKIEAEGPPAALLKEIRERPPITYKYRTNYIPCGSRTNKSSGVEEMVSFGGPTGPIIYMYTNNTTLYRVAPDYMIDYIKWHLVTEGSNISRNTNAVKTNPGSFEKLEGYLRENKIKFKSNLHKSELRNLCMSF